MVVVLEMDCTRAKNVGSDANYAFRPLSSVYQSYNHTPLTTTQTSNY